MGTVPNRHPVYMNEINAALGRGNNLGAYRNQQFWRGASPYTVSNSPSMGEFPGLSSANQMVNQVPYTVNMTGDALINLAYTPRTGNLEVLANTGIVINSWSAGQLFDPSQYQSIGLGYQITAGGTLLQFNIIEGQNVNDPNGRNVVQYWMNGIMTIQLLGTGNPR